MEKNIQNHIRNPLFRDNKLYFKNNKFRDHLYDFYQKILFLKDKKKFKNIKFNEINFTNFLMRKRMLNELFYESVPVILKEEDLNCMNNSIENRAPYLDKSLIEFLFTIPTKMLIRKGFTKFLLREVSKNSLAKKYFTILEKLDLIIL